MNTSKKGSSFCPFLFVKNITGLSVHTQKILTETSIKNIKKRFTKMKRFFITLKFISLYLL